MRCRSPNFRACWGFNGLIEPIARIFSPMKQLNWKAVGLFAVLNFAALAIGGLFTGPGVQSDWYANLNQAPWIPPGATFGIAWTVVMLSLTVFMGQTQPRHPRRLYLWYAIQWLLNVAWNPLFFEAKLPDLALLDLVFLLASVLMMWRFCKRGGWWLVPYVAWLVVATSLNVWVVLFNP